MLVKRVCFIFILGFLFFKVSLAQLSNNPAFKDVDITKLTPDQIPSEDELKKLGATPEEVKSLMELKNKQASQLLIPPSIPPSTPDNQTLIQSESSVQSTEAQPLPVASVYGQDFFRNKNIKFYDKASDAKASDNYILAAGDEISISVWGYSAYNETFAIDKDGAIKPTETGRIYLKGLNFSDAKSLITKRFGEIFDLKNSKIEITLVYSRVITVNIVGEVFNPGSYSIPAINTAFNALVAANGPTSIGSIRNIYVKRGGKTIKRLDVYEFLLNPSSDEEFFLEDNDYIFVPPAEKTISIFGGIKRPQSYELIENEDIQTLIKYAGGLTANAYSQAVQIKRITDNRIALADLSLDSLILSKKNYPLYDGDEVFVKMIPDIEENFVEITGAVRVPGKYELKTGDKILDLINKAEGILDLSYLERAYLIRQKSDLTKEYIFINLGAILKNGSHPENLKLQKYDLLEVFSKTRFLDPDSINIMGSVRIPRNYMYGEGMTVKDAIYLAGGFKKEAANNRIEISRVVNLTDTAKRIIIANAEISKDLSLPDGMNEFKLQPHDIIFVRKIAQFSYQENVFIEGEVNYPGAYTLMENEKIADLIERAGGLTPFAFLGGASLLRNENKTGYLFLELEKVMKNKASRSNYILKEGDNIVIPKINELVALRGAINYPDIEKIGQLNGPFTKGKRAGFYIHRYGAGFADNAEKGKTYVAQPGGYVKKTFNLTFIHIYPKVKIGSTIYAQYEVEKAPKAKKAKKEPINWNTIIENTTVKITGVLTLWILLSSLTQ